MRITRRPIFVIAAFTSTALAVSCGDDHLSPAPAGKVGNARSALTFTADPSTKICQLTGTFDRQPPHLATAQQRSGVPSTVEGTDLGYGFVQGNKLRFFFGDTHDFAPDVCEPDVCGTQDSPLGPLLPSPKAEERVRRAPSLEAWQHHLRARGDGAETMARAAVNSDPENCLSLSFDSQPASAFVSHAFSGGILRSATSFSGALVASRAEDRFVAMVPGGVAVVTDSSEVWFHPTAPFNTIVEPHRLDGSLPVPAGSARTVLSDGDRLVTVATDGSVFVQHIDDAKVSSAEAAGQVDLSNAKWVTNLPGALLIVTHAGQVVRYAFTATFALSTAQTLVAATDSSASPPGPVQVGVRAEDNFVTGFAGGLLVSRNDGDAYLHPIQLNTVLVANKVSVDPATGANVAIAPTIGDVSYTKFVLAEDNTLYTVSPTPNLSRKTTLDGHTLGRREGFVSGLADENGDVISFATARYIVPGCSSGKCAHDDVCYDPTGCVVTEPILGFRKPNGTCPAPGEAITYGTIGSGMPVPGGISIISTAPGGDSSQFTGHSVFSTSKFLWPMPERFDGTDQNVLPPFARTNKALLVFGTGRDNNYGLNPTPWNSSAPHLAITTLEQARTSAGQVFAHQTTPASVNPPTMLGGALVAAYPDDKHVYATEQYIYVITKDGRTFRHAVSSSSVDPAERLIQSSCGLVGALAQDKWVLGNDSNILVITTNGQVWGHSIQGSTVSNAYAYSGPAVGAQTQDKHVLLVGSRLIVITSSGHAFAHDVNFSAHTIGAGYALSQSYTALVGARPGDKVVTATGNRIYVVTDNGSVWWHDVTATAIGPAYAMNMSSGTQVGVRDEDKFVFAKSDPICSAMHLEKNCRDTFFVITRPKVSYFASTTLLGDPVWSDREEDAAALVPFGTPHLDTLGYFSVRFIPAIQRWAMMGTSNGAGERIPRGVYISTAEKPWGPWTDPVMALEEGDAYCKFMYNANAEASSSVCPSGTNPSEEGRRGRDGNNLLRGFGGAYIAYLLPGDYAKYDAERRETTIYYGLSVWNPYQVMLMKTVLHDVP